MPPDCGVGGMEDRPRPHHRLGSQEQVLDLEQVTVSQDRLQWRDLRVGAQDEDAVEACLLRELAGIDLERGPMLHLGGLAQVARRNATTVQEETGESTRWNRRG